MNVSEIVNRRLHDERPRLSNEELTFRVEVLEKSIDFLLQILRLDMLQVQRNDASFQYIKNPCSEERCKEKDEYYGDIGVLDLAVKIKEIEARNK